LGKFNKVMQFSTTYSAGVWSAVCDRIVSTSILLFLMAKQKFGFHQNWKKHLAVQ